mgnify:CR=1 FL=1
MFALIPEAVWWLVGGGAAAAGAGLFAKDTGKGVDSTGNGFLKIAVAGVVLFVVAKKFKVI